MTIAAAGIIAAGAASCGRSAASHQEATAADTLLMLVGSYADKSTEGISLYAFNQADGSARRIGGLSGISNPSFITLSPDGKHIYSVGEDPGATSTVNTVAFDRDSLTMNLVASDTTGGGAPCHVTLSPSGSHVLTANYLGGSLTIYRLDDDGTPLPGPQVIRFSGTGADPERQDQPHAHFASFTPDGKRLLVTDLGTDRIHIFPVIGGDSLIDAAAMTDLMLAPGAGPRHIDYHPSLPVAYLIDEIDGQINVIDLDSTTVTQRVSADTVGAKGSGDIHITPDGRYLYASNRLKADGLAIFKVDPYNGRLQRIGYQLTGKHPRNFAITPNGRYILVASRDENAIEVYRLNDANGMLTRIKDLTISTPKPVCIKFTER